ncbi:MAG: hypothetical protein AWU57_4010 [Marinobacter sp. T13-3]|nr:MAG: hypothetical protein AWU57_4010 [Marinobacter sp. T13-3]
MDMPAFDELRELAQRDPIGFEALRAKLIEDFIQRSPESSQRRLRGLQFVIDARRRTAGSPMKAMMLIQTMMYDSLYSLQQALLFQSQPVAPPIEASSRVLPFRRPGSS